MPVGFGTSGVRGRVTELTDRVCVLYVRAFYRHAREQGAPPAVALAGDLRSSTPRLLRAAAWAIGAEGGTSPFAGFIPTPALAHYARQRGCAALMVTGSHIPDDRNGLKFYLPGGEILKADEAAIARHYAALETGADTDPTLEGAFDAGGMFCPEVPPQLPQADPAALEAYQRRYLEFFPRDCLAGRRLVLYEHSTVAREPLGHLLERLGARVIRVGRAEHFQPVDTEAVDNLETLAAWVRAEHAEALVSADGDGDRPLVVDEQGRQVRGDLLGLLTAQYLRADVVAAPVSCTTAIERCGAFPRVVRTRIGSPYVVATLEEARQAGAHRPVGFEANGGVLLAGDVAGEVPGTFLAALPTRDAVLPILAVLHAAGRRAMRLWQLVAELPPRFTASGLLRPFPTRTGRALVERLAAGGLAAARAFWGTGFGEVQAVDFTDGVRVTLAGGDILHIRPSGNAPEFRVYTEAASPEAAEALNARAREWIRQQAGPDFNPPPSTEP